jgi:hypothetical protein
MIFSSPSVQTSYSMGTGEGGRLILKKYAETPPFCQMPSWHVLGQLYLYTMLMADG